jgi:hypothetical protein
MGYVHAFSWVKVQIIPRHVPADYPSSDTIAFFSNACLHLTYVSGIVPNASLHRVWSSPILSVSRSLQRVCATSVLTHDKWGAAEGGGADSVASSVDDILSHLFAVGDQSQIRFNEA